MTTLLLLCTAGVLILTLIEIRHGYKLRHEYGKIKSALDGYKIQRALSDKARARTSPTNVSDVLDAIDSLTHDERTWQ